MNAQGAWQQELLKRRKANTFKERRKEGRTMHTKASKTSMIVGAIGLLFNVASLLIPQWRSSWVALIGYGSRRYWGLLAVQGRKMTLHHTMYDNNCKWYGHLMIGNSCISPICRWYLLKCNLYFDLCIISYGCLFFVALGVLVHALCLYWTVALSPRTLKWSAGWWPVAAVMHLAAGIAWIILTENIFEQLDEESWYPVPPPGISFFLAMLGGLSQLVCAYIACNLTKMWPEVDPDDPYQFMTDSEEEGGYGEDSDEEDSEDEDPKKQAQAQKGAQAAPPGPAPALPQPVESRWIIKDEADQESGPYTAAQVKGMLASSTVTADTQIRAEHEQTFARFGDVEQRFA
mmetsp:Transcript_55845/g.133572  ORF Transcript_55845/g.133572 Transcript_55845/m.133572 type:complete len:346 (+) Transcript_55845:110-1147(+)|eukprot:CAMPEP_0181435450 /NCGR_PEP_ID=MMETSP1110-20121109/20340_1 /TAXON_ID=174948 /ORGANISM="Symbiodinium sp., Strain CCMP421" /LENGTH=345 /DNA_ID=CAMNT_0023558987 /DNA_START=108 /DNA_END=1145 /DNA_ORIENTATION=+